MTPSQQPQAKKPYPSPYDQPNLLKTKTCKTHPNPPRDHLLLLLTPPAQPHQTTLTYLPLLRQHHLISSSSKSLRSTEACRQQQSR